MATAKKKTVKKKTAKKTSKKPAKKAAPKAVKVSASKSASVVASGMPAIGGKAPAFKCADETGKVISLSKFAGKPVVLYFYPKDDTPGCTVEACDFRDSLQRLKAAGVTVLGVSRDSGVSHQKFKTKHGLNFPLLADVDGKVCEAYGAWQEKSLYGRKFMGIVRCTFLIDSSGKIAALWPKVKVAGHVDEVLEAIGQLG
jgi:peroxiredoxin Q/BCP